MATIKDLISNIVASSSEGEVQVGDGIDDRVGVLAGGDAKTWTPDQDTLKVAQSYGYGQGALPFYPLSSPNGRTVGFPFPSPRPHQLEAVDSICNAFAQGYDAIFEAGTGFGKSPAEIGVVSQFNSAYLLIGRNDLVDQWEHDFEGFRDIGFYKARQRFDCEVIMGEGKRLTCSQAKSLCNRKRKEAKNQQASNAAQGNFGGTHCPACPYAVNRDVALSKPYTVMTLSLGLTIFKYMAQHPGVTKRDVLIIDECSELESEIMKFFEFQASTRAIFKAIDPSTSMFSFYPKADDEFYSRWNKVDPSMNFGEALLAMKPDGNLSACVTWALDIGSMVSTRMTWLRDGNEEQEKIEEACERIVRMSKNMIDCIQSKIPHYCEVQAGEGDDKDDPDHYTILVSPLEARGMLETLAAPFAKRLLFVSATTGTAEMFIASHGYQRPLVKLQSPSGFPIANRPIYSLRAGNMSARTQATDAPKVMDMLVKIAKSTDADRFNHIAQKGVVHTYNNKITDMVVAALRDAGMARRTLVLRGGGKARQQTMDTFKRSSEPLILVSPSAMLGLSLNDDMGRWQAIVKVPYAYLGDQSVSYRKDNINGWYEWQTAKDMIQTFGRIVRSETDWGITYILDDAFSRFYAQNWRLFPAYIQEAVWQSQ